MLHFSRTSIEESEVRYLHAPYRIEHMLIFAALAVATHKK